MKKVFLYGTSEKRQNYAAALSAYGAAPVVSLDLHEAASCQALLLPGGADMDPAFYNAPNLGSRGVDRALDEIEMGLAKEFAASGRPVLGICRGEQLLNVAFGGDLIQDLPTAAAHRWEESTGDKQHMAIAAPGSFLAGLYGERFSVNSAHHQGVGRVAPGFQIAARAEDGVIEALEWAEKRIYGVQWHPERMTLALSRPDTVDGGAVFRFFLNLLNG